MTGIIIIGCATGVGNQYTAHLKSARVNYYSNLIGQCAGDSWKLFRLVNSLSKEPLGTYVFACEHDNATKLANEFASFFVTKTELIKEDLNKIHVQEPRLLAVNAVEKLHHFSALSIEDVSQSYRPWIHQCILSTWSCSNMATEVLLWCIDPFHHWDNNMSFVTGFVPDIGKLPMLFLYWWSPVLIWFLKTFALSVIFLLSLNLRKRLYFRNCSTTVKIMPHFPNYGFLKFHSTETTLLKVQSDILLHMDY